MDGFFPILRTNSRRSRSFGKDCPDEDWQPPGVDREELEEEDAEPEEAEQEDLEEEQLQLEEVTALHPIDAVPSQEKGITSVVSRTALLPRVGRGVIFHSMYTSFPYSDLHLRCDERIVPALWWWHWCAGL